MTAMQLSIIVAVYSETISLEETVERLLKNDRGYIKEIILAVSPRSTDECMQVCKKLVLNNNNVRMHIQKNNPGQGWAFREGIDISRGTHAAIMSADLETEPELIGVMVNKIEETGCDIVTASRWLQGGGFKGYGSFKVMANLLFQRFFMFLFRTGITDLTFGFRIFRLSSIKDIKWGCHFHDFCLESILKPIRYGLDIRQVPAMWVKRKEGESKNCFINYFRYFLIGFKVLFSK